jgi:hypothetical protein
VRDELDEYLGEALKDPSFAAAYAAAEERAYVQRLVSYPAPLAVDGRGYRRRQLARRRRRNRN